MCTIFVCITIIAVATISVSENLDLGMLMYNLIEYSSKCSDTTGSLWFYAKDEATNFNVDIGNKNNF